MKFKNLFLPGVLALISGGLWAYSFSTRIGLLFVIPLWMKIIVMAGLTVNFTLLGLYLAQKLSKGLKNKRIWIWLLAAAIGLSSILFWVLPYHRIPFRTTHQLSITSLETNVEIRAIYSPNNNRISREAFEFGEDVEPFDETGFRIPPGSSIHYSRAQTGGLTVSFEENAGPVTMTWDETTQQIDPGNLLVADLLQIKDWGVTIDQETSRVNIILPGNTWGQPDTFWSILGTLLPIADFFTLVTLIFGLSWLAVSLRQDQNISRFNWGLLIAWLSAIGLMGLIVISFNIGITSFFPWRAAALFMMTVLSLGYYQITRLSLIRKMLGINKKTIETFEENTTGFYSSFNQNRIVLWILLVIIAIIGSAALFVVTQPGMGASGDSVHYMEGASNLAEGLGYTRHIKIGEPIPITGFPPGYPAMLFLGIKLGLDVMSAARVLNILLFFIFLVLIGWLIFHITQRVLPAVLASAFTMMLVPMLTIFAWVMSEPLYMVLVLVIMALWLRYIKKPSLQMILLLGLLSGFLVLVRLAGLSFVGAVVIGILLFRPGKGVKRWLAAFVYGLISILPTIAFFYRNSIVGESISESRGFNINPFKMDYWKIMGDEIASWLHLRFFIDHNAIIYAILLLLVGAMAAIYLIHKIRERRSEEQLKTTPLNDLLVMTIGLYIVMIVLNVVIFTPEQTISGLSRYTLSLFPILVIWTASMLTNEVWRWKFILPKAIIIVSVAVLFVFYVMDAAQFVQSPPIRMRGYTDIVSDCEDKLDLFDGLPENADIYTNNCEFVHFASGLRCYHLPQTPESFEPGGEVYEDVANGDIILYMQDYGFDPPGIDVLLDDLTIFRSGCLINFYRWPTQNP